MQQLLSYQTAMRVNDEQRDVRAYITKRTCVSLIFSIGFFTLVIGFLLGKFVTSRQYRMKQLQEPELIAIIRQIPALKSTATVIFHNISERNDTNVEQNITNSSNFIRPFNLRLWNKMVWCGRTVDYDFNVTFDIFISNLLDLEIKKMHNCLQELKLHLNALNNNYSLNYV